MATEKRKTKKTARVGKGESTTSESQDLSQVLSVLFAIINASPADMYNERGMLKTRKDLSVETIMALEELVCDQRTGKIVQFRLIKKTVAIEKLIDLLRPTEPDLGDGKKPPTDTTDVRRQLLAKLEKRLNGSNGAASSKPN